MVLISLNHSVLQDTLTGSEEVALVLSMAACPQGSCTSPQYNPSEILGQILYNGPYNPQPHPEAGLSKPPHQNFSIPVPTSLAPGDTVSLIATHFNLVGVSWRTHTRRACRCS